MGNSHPGETAIPYVYDSKCTYRLYHILMFHTIHP